MNVGKATIVKATTQQVYPLFVTWRMDLGTAHEFADLISKKQAQRVKKALALLASSDYRFAVDTVDADYLNQFVPPYEGNIGQKKHATVFNVRDTILEKQKTGRVYESISLRKGDTLLGGVIYSIRERSVSVAYRTFPHKLFVHLPISCSYIAEHYLVARALELHKKKISHGRDINVYGQNSDIGLADYKLRIGATPYASLTPRNEFKDVTTLHVTDDTLVLLATERSQRVSQAVLYSRLDETAAAEKYNGLLKQKLVTIALQPI